MLRGYLSALTNRNIALLALSSMLLSVSGAFFTWMLPIAVAKLGSAIYLGVAYTAAYAVSAPLSLVSGVLADSYGRKPLMVLSASIVAATYGLVLLHTSATTLSVAVVALTVSSALSAPVASSLVAESVEAPLRGYAFTLTNFVSSVSLAVGSFTLRVLAGRGLREVALITLTLSSLSLSLRLLLRETLATEHRGAGVHVASGVRSFFKSFGKIAELWSLGLPYVYLSVMAVLGAASSTLYSVYMPVYFNLELGLPEGDVGLVYTIASLASLAVLLVGSLVSALGALRSLQVALLFMALPTVSLSLLPRGSLVAVLALVSVSTLASALSQVSGSTLVSDLTSQSIRGTVFGSLALVSLIASIAAPPLGVAVLSLSRRLIPALTGGLLALSLAVSVLLKRSVMVREVSKSLPKGSG